MTTDDTLTLQVGNQVLSGWQRVSVTRSMDDFPAKFDLEVTEKYPSTADVDIKPGQPCTVSIGGDLVLTGYVDRYGASLSGSMHTIRVQGRSKSSDLVDCSAFTGSIDHPQTQVRVSTALQIARILAAPYGVTINSLAGDGTSVPQFNLNLGETVWEVIDRLLRISGFVAYDMPDGSVMFARAGTESMASGFQVGQNVEAADVTYSMDQRFSDYEGHFLSVMGYVTDPGVNATQVGPVVHDAGVPRFRKRFVVSEQMSDGESIAGLRAKWECNRRQGRSQQFNVVTDSWRDTAGALWAPNHLAPIDATMLKLGPSNWLIGGVTYTRDEDGQHAQLTLMPPSAFDPEPTAAVPVMPLLNHISGINPTAPNAPKASDEVVAT
jgi:prophage tail gpP-like protein